MTAALWISISGDPQNVNHYFKYGTINADPQYAAGIGFANFFIAHGADNAFVAPTLLRVNTWMHVAVVINATEGTYTLYVDGRFAGALAYDPAVPGQQLTFGGRHDTGTLGNPWEGNLAVLKIWERALTQAEIQAEIPYVVPQQIVGLWGWYPRLMTNGAVDISGHAHDFAMAGILQPQTIPPPVIWDRATHWRPFPLLFVTATLGGQSVIAVPSQMPWAAQAGMVQRPLLLPQAQLKWHAQALAMARRVRA